LSLLLRDKQTIYTEYIPIFDKHFKDETLTFDDFNFEPSLLEGIHYMGFKTATPIQEQAIPAILQGRDLIACAQTGTGKTAAFLLPIINKLSKEPSDYTDTLVIVPTRELAIQINEALQAIAYFAPVNSHCIYGGSSGAMFDEERSALTTGTNIIIATPGRLISHLNLGYVKFDKVKHLVLDEADRMLDMGFSEDLNKIISFLPKERETVMFSATMPPKIRKLAKDILKNPLEINVAVSKPAEGVTQGAYVVNESQKMPVLDDLLVRHKDLDSILIFASTRKKVKDLEKELKKLKFNVGAIHSDLEQAQRNDILRQFKNKSLQVLVATDILSRGIDIDSIGMVINFDVPQDGEDYIHRVGRTARAATKGAAITFISKEDQRRFKRIEDLIGSEVNKLPVAESFGPVPAYSPESFSENRGPGKKPFRRKKSSHNRPRGPQGKQG
jgi:superfamily II DNA/RNA helicase